MNGNDTENFSKLIHHLSHDVKNILHNIYGFSQLLEDEIEPKYVERIQKLIMKCNDVIKEYVEKVDAGNFTVPFDSQK